jgi:hypothetical protein
MNDKDKIEVLEYIISELKAPIQLAKMHSTNGRSVKMIF